MPGNLILIPKTVKNIKRQNILANNHKPTQHIHMQRGKKASLEINYPETKTSEIKKKNKKKNIVITAL